MRRWREQDLEPFAALNADPLVMEHFPATLARDASDALLERIDQAFESQGWGLWALELADEGAFVGFTGLAQVRPDMPFAPAVELAWRLAREFWGRGLASEAARSAAEFGFERAGLQELVAYTAERNTRSRRVMERLAMVHDQGADFLHPAIAPADGVAPHVLYRLGAARGRANKLEGWAAATPTPPARKN
jgi:RimJ/RimL family protein N-acetyltransferase